MNLPALATLPLLALLASCARPAYQQRGYASYIADQYAGRATASGEIYAPYGWTAAHHTLPFGTQVKVKNHANGRAVNVTVNDRFPYYPGRVINVSRAAAEHLQIPPHGLADVTVTARTIPGGVAPSPAAPPPPSYGPPPSAGYQATPPPPSYGTPSSAPPVGLPPPPPGYGLPPAQ